MYTTENNDNGDALPALDMFKYKTCVAVVVFVVVLLHLCDAQIFIALVSGKLFLSKFVFRSLRKERERACARVYCIYVNNS
jgi:Mn2+/Fe2+ NRAMP family transporter